MPEDAFGRPGQNPNIITQQPTPSEQPAPQQTAPIGAPTLSEQPQQPAQPQPEQQPQQVPQQTYQPDWQSILAERQRMQQLEQQNSAMQQRLQEQDTAINNLLQVQQDYDNLKRQQALEQEAAGIDFGSLASVDESDARAISSQVLKSVEAKLDPLVRELNAQRQQMQQNFAYQNQRAAQMRDQTTLKEVMARHPDFLSLANDPGFNAFMKQRDGFTSKTLDDRAAEEFKLGNSAYVSYIVDQYKQQRPTTSSISSVAPVQTATSVNAQTAPAGQPAAQTFTLHDLNTLMQMRQITPEQYRAELAKLKSQAK